MKKRASSIIVGDYLINLGFVTSVEHYDQYTRIVVLKGLCISAAFFWFSPDTLLTVDTTKVEDQ